MTGRSIFVTGATGFVGRHVVAEAAARGHQVVALVRPASSTSALDPAIETGQVSVVRGDLASPDLADHMAGCDVVVHLAAVKGGDFFSRFAGTVIGTESLLTAARTAGVRHLVAVSTFSVYDYGRRPARSVFDEDFPVIDDPRGRDEYAETKLYQDELYRDFGDEPDNLMVMVRPGMIYGRDQLWHPLLGGEFGPIDLRVGARARPPITYVENTAEALVLAAEALLDPSRAASVDGEVINIVDDDLPTQADYVKSVGALEATPSALLVPLPVMKVFASAVAAINRRVFDGRMKVPSIALPDQVDARFKPFDYRNDKAKRLLGWTPRFDLQAALRRSTSSLDLVADRVATQSSEAPSP
jgi:nucleoside-diphosphate-sugar epimerase